MSEKTAEEGARRVVERIDSPVSGDYRSLYTIVVGEIRAAVQAETEPLLDVIESCFSVGEVRFGNCGLAITVRRKVMKALIAAGRIDDEGAAIRQKPDEGGEGEDG